MKAIDRRAAEFRALQATIQASLRDLDLAAVGRLSLSLSIQEFRSLEFLAFAERRKTKELAEYLGLAVNSVTEIVDSLENKGLVQRRRDEADRRVVRLELTDTGREAARTIVISVQDIARTYLGALTPSEQETLLTLYRKVARALRPES
jgi:DNA-binding MarR family transcriptional regulator